MVANVHPGSFYKNVPLGEKREQGKGALTLENLTGLPQLIAAQHHCTAFSIHRSPGYITPEFHKEPLLN